MASLNLGLRVGAQHHRLLRVTADSKRTLYELAARRAESTAEGVDVGVVEDAVDHGGGNSLVAENLRDRLDAGSLPAGATIRILVRPQAPCAPTHQTKYPAAKAFQRRGYQRRSATSLPKIGPVQP